MLVSIIIPALQEENCISGLIHYIRKKCIYGSETEIIVADGFSSDGTVLRSTEAGARTIQVSKGRSRQMNSGASIATGDVLFFLHADTIPPPSFLANIRQAFEEGYAAGCFQLSFDYPHWFLRFNCWFTRFDFLPFRFGDQGLFIRRNLFEEIGRFNEKLLLMEDQEIIKRIKQKTRFKIFDQSVTTSARKYLTNGIFRLQLIFTLIYFLYQLGMSQEKLVRLYKRLIRDDKLDEIVGSDSRAEARDTVCRLKSAVHSD
jgi:rSAM/selenodomain-associated transferase 2